MHLGILTIGLNLIFLVQCAVSSPCFFWTSALYSNGYCYKFESTQLNWTDAKAYCSGSISQAKLADGDNADWDYVIRTINQTNQEWWIDGELSLLQCAKLMYTSSRSVVPSFEKCETKREFICQLYVGDPCETALSRGEYFNDGNCYALYHSTKVFFDAANETCAVKESRLAEFFSMEAYYYFRNRMNYLIGSLSDPSIFLGGSDLLHEGVFTWFSTDTNISINDWIPNEPNNGNTGEHHLSWRVVTGEEFHLNDVNGTDKKGFAICQKDVLNITYLIVLPDSDVSVVKSSVIQVTSGDLEVTYLHFTQRLNDMQVNTTYDWVTSYHDVIYTVDSTIEMSGTGIYRGVVQLRANHHVTVVLHQTSGSEVGTTLVFPVDLVTTGYFVLTNASQESGSQITITALNSDTDVTVKLPRKQLQPFTISVGGFTIQHADKATIHLDQLDTAHLQSSEDFSGSFVYATKPVVVYSGSKNVQTAENTWDHTLDMSVPVDSLSTEYVTFPSSSSASDTFRLLALYDDTEIAVHGGALFNVSISKAGYHEEISPPPGSFYYMKSDPYHPFYVIKISSSPNGACMTSLLPWSLWRSQYDVNTRFHETLYLAMDFRYVEEFTLQNAAACIDIAGTTYSGCTMTLSPGYHHIGLNAAGFTFAAYGSQSLDSSYCHVLGTSDGKERGDVVENNSQVAFQALQYSTLKGDAPFPPPNLPQTTTFLATTTPESGTTTPAYQADLSAKGEHDIPTTEQHHMSAAAPAELSTTARQAPQTQSETTSRQTPTASSVDTVSATAPAASFSNANLSACTALCMPQLNVSAQQLTAIAQKIHWALFVNPRDTFLFKQKKKCTWDDRPSCHAIGVSGVVMMICWILFLTSPDMFRLLRFLFLFKKNTTRENIR